MVDVCAQLHGATSVAVEETRSRVAAVYLSMGDNIAASEMYAALARDQLQLRGVHDAAHMRTMSSLAHCATSAGTRASALLEVFKLQTSTAPVEQLDVAVTSERLAVVLYAQGNFVESDTLLKGVVAARTCILGDDHAFTLRAVSQHAATLAALNRRVEAKALRLHVYSAKLRTLGADHPSTLAALMHAVK
jgi:SHS2 domain-containing protein